MMNHLKWIYKEALFRKWQLILLLLGPMIAISVSTSCFKIAHIYDYDAQSHLEAKQKDLKKQMDHLWDEYRKMTKDLGFNVLVLPKDQNLSDFYAENFASRYMPESYADTLALSNAIIIEHILPALFIKTFWSEMKRSVFICGTRGELSRNDNTKPKDQMTPIMEIVPEGSIVCGYEIVKSCGLREGQSIQFSGHPFTISKCMKQKGNRDDITIWMPLHSAQQVFNKEGLINAIFALECRCAADENLANLAKIRIVLEKILPQTQVIEFMSEVIDRAETRYEAIKVQQNALEQEKSFVNEQHNNRSQFIIILLIIVFLCSALLITYLTFLNVGERLHEIGMLRAIGFKGPFILALFSFKLIIIGLIGSIIGLIDGNILVQFITVKYIDFTHKSTDFSILIYFLITGSLLTLLAGLPPVMYGLTKHPAHLLKGNT